MIFIHLRYQDFFQLLGFHPYLNFWPYESMLVIGQKSSRNLRKFQVSAWVYFNKFHVSKFTCDKKINKFPTNKIILRVRALGRWREGKRPSAGGVTWPRWSRILTEFMSKCLKNHKLIYNRLISLNLANSVIFISIDANITVILNFSSKVDTFQLKSHILVGEGVGHTAYDWSVGVEGQNWLRMTCDLLGGG